jgi:hypothetical protein
MTRRRLFALAGGASAAATLPDIAAPIVEMHANDVAPLPPSAINDLLRGEMIVFREDRIRMCMPCRERQLEALDG